MDMLERANKLFDRVQEELGAEELALNLFKAMDKAEAIDLLQYICQCWEINEGEEE